MKNSAVITLLVVGCLVAACETEPKKGGGDICAKAIEMIKRNAVELVEPRDWNRLMAASSRLVYLENDCGELITESQDELCASLGEAIETFETNPAVPLGANRDSALTIGSQIFKQSGCEEF